MYLIGDLLVDAKFEFDIMKSRSKPFIVSNEENRKCDICIPNLQNSIYRLKKEHPNLSYGQCEVLQSARYIFNCLVQIHMFFLHASVVVVNNEAYVFCAQNGGGKSTHAKLWIKYFGTKAYSFCDDRPIIGLIGNDLYVWSSPWSKVSNEHIQKKVKVHGIYILKKAIENKIKKLCKEEGIKAIMSQYPLQDKFRIRQTIILVLSRLLNDIGIFELRCNTSIDSVKLVYEETKKMDVKNKRYNSDI